ncbi:hypothetical protein BD289DRAFT_459310 [Coniella lustricola]|uniref:Short chain dehydrogenase n=1 Tax=Coniella lustricola TaxID=2025994 RepID=A0A2T3AF92_9PEZI|nr:hypothetical protein BD289DRAFT_459310 [Coniella lustricola]
MASDMPVALVIGASRGIGRQIAVDLARNNYAVVVAAKSTSNAHAPNTPFPPDPNSPQSTVSTVQREICEAGGEATAIPVDVRDAASVEQLVDQTIAKYSRLDVLIYNPGAIWWASVQDTPTKRFQLMQRVNVEGLYAAVQASLPHLLPRSQRDHNQQGIENSKKDSNSTRRAGRIIVVSPPIYSRFFRGKTAYAMGKVAMSVLTIGLGMDFERQGLVKGDDGCAVTSIWPAVAIQSAATSQFTSRDPSQLLDLRKPTIFSDAILAILGAPASLVNGRTLIDEDFLRSRGLVRDFDGYSVVPRRASGREKEGKAAQPPRRIMPLEFPDLTVREQDDEGSRIDSSKAMAKL